MSIRFLDDLIACKVNARLLVEAFVKVYFAKSRSSSDSDYQWVVEDVRIQDR